MLRSNPSGQRQPWAERIAPERIEVTGNTIVEAGTTALPRRHIGTFGLIDIASTLWLTEPLDYPVLLALTRHTAGLITDSGGKQRSSSD